MLEEIIANILFHQTESLLTLKLDMYTYTYM